LGLKWKLLLSILFPSHLICSNGYSIGHVHLTWKMTYPHLIFVFEITLMYSCYLFVFCLWHVFLLRFISYKNWSACFFMFSLLCRHKLLLMSSTLGSAHRNSFPMTLPRYTYSLSRSFLFVWYIYWIPYRLLLSMMLITYIGCGYGYGFDSWSAIVIHQRTNTYLMMFWVTILCQCYYIKIINCTCWVSFQYVVAAVLLIYIFLSIPSHVCPSSSGAWTCCCSSNYFMYYRWYTSLWWEQPSICFFHFPSLP
jgi:hypothetical protein